MDGRHRPAAVSVVAVLIALSGLVLLLTPWIVLGPAALVLAAGVWRGSRWAAWTGVVAGLAALLPAAYGVWGTSVVLQDWNECADERLASLATSRPVGYCGFVDWVEQFGIGIALILPGVLGLITVFVLLRHARFFRSPST